MFIVLVYLRVFFTQKIMRMHSWGKVTNQLEFEIVLFILLSKLSPNKAIETGIKFRLLNNFATKAIDDQREILSVIDWFLLDYLQGKEIQFNSFLLFLQINSWLIKAFVSSSKSGYNSNLKIIFHVLNVRWKTNLTWYRKSWCSLSISNQMF